MSAGPITVRADLALSVAGQSARLTGDGTHLTLAASDPVALWRSAAEVPWPVGVTVGTGPRGLGKLGDLLAEQGLHLEVTGPQGRVAELGAGVSSPLGRALTGSSALRPGSPGTLLGTLAAQPVPWRAAGVAVAAALAVLIVRRRR